MTTNDWGSYWKHPHFQDRSDLRSSGSEVIDFNEVRKQGWLSLAKRGQLREANAFYRAMSAVKEGIWPDDR